MELALSETQKLIRDTAARFAKDLVAPRARMTDRAETFPVEVYCQPAAPACLTLTRFVSPR